MSRITIGSQQSPTAADRVAAALDEVRIIVRIAPGLDPIAAAAAGALVSMVSRIHHHVELDGDAALAPNPWGATQLSGVLDAVASHRPDSAAEYRSDLVLVVGDAAGDIGIGGDDWTVRVGEPSPAAASRFGFGLQAAAAFGASEALKVALKPIGMVAVSARFEWDLLTHAYGRTDPPDGTGIVGDVIFAGAGSVNSSAAAVLMPAPPGRRAIVVDPDTFDVIKNPYRYPAARAATNGAKAPWVAGMLAEAGWIASGVPIDIATWVQTQINPGFDGTIVSSVDSVPGRADVADVLARTTLSAGVEALALHVQREHSFDTYACPNCDFADVGAPITQAQVYADATGIELHRIAALIDGDVINDADVDAVSRSGKLPSADGLLGRRLADVIARVYAEATVPVGAVPVRVSAPFVSWMAGTLLAVEISKPGIGAAQIDRRIDLDMAGVPTGAVGRRLRNEVGHCACASPWRRRATSSMAATQAA
jgi:hypothetical protein